MNNLSQSDLSQTKDLNLDFTLEAMHIADVQKMIARVIKTGSLKTRSLSQFLTPEYTVFWSRISAEMNKALQ